jgi:hypothetical protein
MKRITTVILANLMAAILMDALSFFLIERKSVYDSTFDPNKLRAMSYEQGVRYASDHTIELTGWDTVRARKDDKGFWENEVAYVLTYTIAGVLGCICYAVLFRRTRY